MMAQVNAGRVRFVGRGEYNNSTQYYVFDLVSYNGNSYYAKADTIAHLPTDTTYWQLVAEKGNVGPTGLTGNGISSIEKTATSGLVDTYTITYTNGNTTTFNVSNGNGIDRIEKTATVGNKDTYTIYFTNGSTTTYEVSNGEVTREELEEEVERLSMIYNAFPSTTGEVEEGSINGTAKVPFKEIGLKGNTSQESTTGKNLFSGDYSQFDSQGGTGSTYAYFKLPDDNKQYTLTMIAKNDFTTSGNTYLGFTGTGGSGSGGVNWVITQAFGTITKGTILSKTSSSVNRFVSLYNKGANYLKNLVDNFDIQLEEGETATSYEPYTNGPAPNPDYPYPVNVVTGDNEVKVEGKNLAYTGWAEDFVTAINDSNYAKLETKDNKNCLFYTPNAGYGDYDNKYMFKINWKENTQYTFNFDLYTTNPNNYGNLLIEYTDGTTTEIMGTKDTWVHKIQTSTSGKTIKYLRVSWRGGNSYIDLDTFMVYEGTDNADYVPYQSQTYPINLGSMELCKIGDYQDYIYKDSDKWYLHKEIGKKIVLESEILAQTDSYTNVRYFKFNKETNDIDYNKYNQTSLFYSHAKLYNGYDYDIAFAIGKILPTTEATRYWIGFSKSSTLSEAKEKLTGSILYYPLKTPTYEEITDTTLIEQLDNLEKAYSYDTQTNISQTNQDKPFIISYEAILSLRNVLNS